MITPGNDDNRFIEQRHLAHLCGRQTHAIKTPTKIVLALMFLSVFSYFGLLARGKKGAK